MNRSFKVIYKWFLIILFLIISISLLIFYRINMGNAKNKNTEEKARDSSYLISYNQGEVINRISALPRPKEITISFAGDFTLGTDTKFAYEGSLPYEFINSGSDYSHFMRNVSDIFKEDDYTLVNLETTFTEYDIKAIKAGDVFYNFKGPKEYVNILNEGNIDGVTISNNHIYDYGEQGFKDTIDTLEQNNIDICGEGYKIIKEIQGINIGFLGYTGWEYTEKLQTKIRNDIAELKGKGAKIVIPYFHWGIERDYKPYETQESIARFAIDNGADCVIGSHPHVIQSLENYKGKMIAYSMGNFCFGGNSNPPDKRTFILQIKINFILDKTMLMEYKVIPVRISSKEYVNDYVPTLYDNKEADKLISTLNELSPTLKGDIDKEFFSIK